MQDNQAARPDVQLALNGERPFAVWIYALAAPFATIAGEVSGKELRELWASGKMPGTEVHQLLVSEETMRLLESAWGQPSPAVKALPEARLLDVAWAPPYSWAILPFEQLEPRWKVLSIDGQSPVHKDFDARDYPLAFTFGLQGAEESQSRLSRIPTAMREK